MGIPYKTNPASTSPAFFRPFTSWSEKAPSEQEGTRVWLWLKTSLGMHGLEFLSWWTLVSGPPKCFGAPAQAYLWEGRWRYQERLNLARSLFAWIEEELRRKVVYCLQVLCQLLQTLAKFGRLHVKAGLKILSQKNTSEPAKYLQKIRLCSAQISRWSINTQQVNKFLQKEQHPEQ